MKQYANICYVSQGQLNRTPGLERAIEMAQGHQNGLKILILGRQFPAPFSGHQQSYEQTLIDKAKELVEQVALDLFPQAKPLALSLSFLTGKTPAVKIIKSVIKDKNDLLIKDAQSGTTRGFKALDMDLLRKCPADLWLCRPEAFEEPEQQIAVAIDPMAESAEAVSLSLRLLSQAEQLAKLLNAKLHIVACWEYELEAEVNNNIFIHIPEEEIKTQVEKVGSEHRQALDALIQKAGIASNHNVQLLRGHVETVIPEYMFEKQIRLLVMGSVARTGIPGFIIGNTAENIFQTLPCSLLALKPEGFVSPIKAD